MFPLEVTQDVGSVDGHHGGGGGGIRRAGGPGAGQGSPEETGGRRPGQYMDQYDEQYKPRISQALSIPRDERERLEEIAAMAAPERREDMKRAMKEYASLRHMKRREAQRRGERDRFKRTMLAVHVPFSYAQAVTARAEEEGVSVYVWLRKAIDAAMRKP